MSGLTIMVRPALSQEPSGLALLRSETPSHVNLPSAYHSGMLNRVPSLPWIDLPDLNPARGVRLHPERRVGGEGRLEDHR